ncbi:MAG: PRC-barrel domain-containing protein [Phycisphaerales bacterium]|nr:PRC-barrel domain-containing protein [Phycisphaerales bacterium]
MTMLAGTPLSVEAASRPALVQPASDVRLSFHMASDLRGTSVHNGNDEVVGVVEDFIIDRGSGMIESIILRDGGLLGFGGRQVAVPYDAFGFDEEAGVFQLRITTEQMKQARAFIASEWMVLEKDTWREAFDRRWSGRESGAAPVDPYTSSLRDAETTTFEGKIRDVRRERTAGGGEQVVIDVDTDGRLQRVILGPAWYVMSQDGAPMHGQAVEVTAFRLPRDGENRLVACDVSSEDGDMSLRSKDGAPTWDAREHDDEVGSPYVLLGDVEDMSVRARAEDGGEVSGSILETRSGRVAMLAIDPDEAILGIGDDLHAIPWTIVSIGSEFVRLDADTSMLKGSPVLLEDTSGYATIGLRSQVYEALQTRAPEFRPRERTDWDPGGTWSSDGALAKAIRDGDERTYTGEIVRTTSMMAADGMARSVAVVIETEEGIRTVLLGPKWFIDRQDLALRDGESITCVCRVAKTKGGEMPVATSIERGTGDRLVLWRDGRPVWDAS